MTLGQGKNFILGGFFYVFHWTRLPVSTLRYYDKEGLFPDIQRVSGIRKFSENELEALRVIDCLKKSGLEIKDIKQFMEWSKEGSKTFEVRKELFEKQKEVVEKEIAKLEEKYNISLNKEEEENMDSVVIKVTIPRYVNKEVKDENFSDM